MNRRACRAAEITPDRRFFIWAPCRARSRPSRFGVSRPPWFSGGRLALRWGAAKRWQGLRRSDGGSGTCRSPFAQPPHVCQLLRPGLQPPSVPHRVGQHGNGCVVALPAVWARAEREGKGCGVWASVPGVSWEKSEVSNRAWEARSQEPSLRTPELGEDAGSRQPPAVRLARPRVCRFPVPLPPTATQEWDFCLTSPFCAPFPEPSSPCSAHPCRTAPSPRGRGAAPQPLRAGVRAVPPGWSRPPPGFVPPATPSVSWAGWMQPHRPYGAGHRSPEPVLSRRGCKAVTEFSVQPVLGSQLP